jgi:hypothetical protein
MLQTILLHGIGRCQISLGDYPEKEKAFSDERSA